MVVPRYRIPAPGTCSQIFVSEVALLQSKDQKGVSIKEKSFTHSFRSEYFSAPSRTKTAAAIALNRTLVLLIRQTAVRLGAIEQRILS